MSKLHYEPEFKNKIIRLHLEDGRTLGSLSQEYNISKSTINSWIKKYREECKTNDALAQEKDYFQETLKLKRQLEELEKENRFLKKAVAFFAKEID